MMHRQTGARRDTHRDLFIGYENLEAKSISKNGVKVIVLIYQKDKIILNLYTTHKTDSKQTQPNDRTMGEKFKSTITYPFQQLTEQVEIRTRDDGCDRFERHHR